MSAIPRKAAPCPRPRLAILKERYPRHTSAPSARLHLATARPWGSAAIGETMKTQLDFLMAFYAILGVAMSFHIFFMALLARESRSVVVQYGDEVFVTFGIFGIMFIAGIVVFLFWVGEYMDEALSRKRYM